VKEAPSADDVKRLATEIAEEKALRAEAKTKFQVREEELVKLVASVSEDAAAKERRLDEVKREADQLKEQHQVLLERHVQNERSLSTRIQDLESHSSATGSNSTG